MNIVNRRTVVRTCILVGFIATVCFGLIGFGPAPANAAPPPVRIGVVPGGGSGIEQDIVDRISGQLQDNPNVALSTVNPDWYVVCNIVQNLDQGSGQIRYNGTVTVKTVDGQVISTTAVQKYNQDFSLSPGTPLNKALVDGAARDVIGALSERAMPPILQAIDTEMETRARMIKATILGDQDKYDEAIELVHPISPETPHFQRVRTLLDQLVMEKQAKEAIAHAESLHKQGKNAAAVSVLRSVNKHSKRYRLAQQKIAQYR